MTEDTVRESRRDDPALLFVRGSFQPASDAVSRSMLELTLSLQAEGRSVHIVSWTTPDHQPMLDRLRPGTQISLTTRPEGGTYTTVDRLRFILRVMIFLVFRVPAGSSVITLEDPTALGIAVLPVRLLRRKIQHVVYLMDLQSVQYLRLRHGGRLTAAVNRVRGWLDRFTWRHADAVVVLGSCMRDLVLQLEPRAAIRVVPIWQDATRIHPVDADAARAELDLKHKFVVLYHGHATYRQPMGTVLAAAEELRSNDRYQFVVSGGGPSIEWLEREVDARGLENVQVYPSIPNLDMLSVLSMADVHLAILDERAAGTCVPSKTYTAMAVGRPCVYIGDSDGQAAIDLRAAGAGYVVASGRHDDLLRSLAELADNDEHRIEMGARGHDFFVRHRDLDEACRRWTALLAER